MTQIIMMLSQLILLPIQMRLWGATATAAWYSALALATITYVVDCGLRSAGHAELIKAAPNPSAFPLETGQFRQIWSWIRLMILLVTGGLFAFDIGVHGRPYPWWRLMLIVACALETLLIIRITYLDSLGKYRSSEASYFFFAVLRLMLAIPALLVFHWNAAGLAGVYLLTAAIGVALQGVVLCRSIPLLQMTDRFPKLSWSALGLARYTVAEPIANWMRLSLPVLVIAQIASPLAVTTYVALRAVFGAMRSSVLQLARVSSVEFLKSSHAGESKRADSILTLFIVVSIFFGMAVGSVVVADNLRILGLWLKTSDRNLFQQTALAFALSAPLFSYQIQMSLMFRTGQLAWVARRHYAFVICCAIFAGVTLLVKSLPIYLVLLVMAEVILAGSFFIPGKVKTALSESASGRAAVRVALVSMLLILLLGVAVRNDVFGIFLSFTAASLGESALLLIAVFSATGGLLYRTYGWRLRVIRKRESGLTPSLVLAE